MKGIMVEASQLPNLIDDLAERYRVYAPTDKDGLTRFGEIKSSSEIKSQDLQSKISSKEIIFPKCEVLFTYKLHGENAELEEPQAKDEKAILFGLPPCEARGFTLIDGAFASGEFKDIYYLRRRENTLIIGRACERPRSTCFCTSVGGSPFGRDGLDMLLQDLGGRYLLEAVSKRGEGLIEALQGYVSATQTDVERAGRAAKAAEESIRTRLGLQGVEGKLEKMFNDPLWGVIYQKCVGCGVCTYLCPTCYCFDIVDEAAGVKRQRIRLWDSCQFSLFTLQGSGENPRPSGKERMRQRIMHKFSYYPKTYGRVACVGCGRCIRECPVNLDIREILKTVMTR